MGLIKKPCELAQKQTVAALIYGQSGMGKSTLACSAPKPVVFDFDGGITRVLDAYQVPTVQIDSFAQALEALKEVEAAGDEYQTIVIDTASKMIDSITTHVCGTATPKIQQWGLINAEFKSFNRAVQSMGKNIVYIAQREVEKDGDVNRYVPQFRASNYKDVICDLDVCGYMEMVSYRGQDVRKLTFDPSPRNEGKNTAQFAASYLLPVLDGKAPNTFLTDRFNEYAERQRAKAEKRAGKEREVNETLACFTEECAACENADDINDLLDAAKDMQAVGTLKIKMSKALAARAKELGLKLNADKRYE